jgi:hypothetical protein
MVKMHIMDKINYKFSQQFSIIMKLLIASLILTIVYFVGASGSVYLFDSAIIYEYGYLISKGYQPFIDFSTPLLPFIGYLQNLAFSVFGFNYFSGVYAGFIVVIFQFLTLSALLLKITKKLEKSILISFLISLCGIPIVGNLYYNHFLISIVSILFILMYFEVKVKSNKFTLLFKFILLTIIFTVKIHWGVSMIFLQLIYDLNFHKKQKIIKEYLIGLSILFFVSFIILYLSNNSSFYNYLSFSKKLSISSNINYQGLLKLIFNFPQNIFNIIEFNPVSIFIILVIPVFYKKDWFGNSIKVELFLTIEILLFAILITLNSTEAGTIYLPLQILILFLCLQYVELEIPNKERIRLKLIIFMFFLIHFLFATITIANGNRKLYNELNGEFTNMPLIPRIFSKQKFHTNSKPISQFFKGVSMSENQSISFDIIDSIINNSNSTKIYFGPELEILNIIYKIEPIKGFPLWVHPGLSITKNDINKLDLLFFDYAPDLVFISKKRSGFIPFINEENMKNHNYNKLIVNNNKCFIECYIKKTQ